MRTVLVLGLVSLPVWGAMPAAEQNALVKKYCAVCHTDAARRGGLSLEHYDASRRDPGLAAMMLSKLNNGAMGAAGQGVPNKSDQRAWLQSTKEQAAGAKEWFVSREGDSVSAGIVREVAPRKTGSTDLPVYRILMACNLSTGIGEMQLTWSPEPQTGRTMAVSVDGNPSAEYKFEGMESMAGTVPTGHASFILNRGKGGGTALANRSLIVADLFPGETVEFPFADLDPKAHAELRKCF